MAVPKKKTSQSRKNMRRSHDALAPNAVSVCKNCGEVVRPHNVCKACGSYNGKQIVENSAK
ncbi:MAG: 50S ribosomal protein L32 [Alphaproteobacteria bacterium]